MKTNKLSRFEIIEEYVKIYDVNGRLICEMRLEELINFFITIINLMNDIKKNIKDVEKHNTEVSKTIEKNKKYIDYLLNNIYTQE
ncbi:hypothetical protein J7K25_03200 [bacterium]|nr:hypothetical protein [bacterium]